MATSASAADFLPDARMLEELETHAKAISSNLDMSLRDLRGSLRGMSDLTLESIQVYSHSIHSTCDAVDSAIKSTYTMLAKAEELTNSMKGVQKLSQQVKDMKRLVNLLEGQCAVELAAVQQQAQQGNTTSTLTSSQLKKQ